MAEVYLSLGSNCEREKHIRAALDALAGYFGALVVSSVYESEAVGFSGASFLNLVVGINTSMSPGALSQLLKSIEDDNGRDRMAPKFSSRTLDIDILTYGDLKGMQEGVALPRAEIVHNAFVLWPLSELAGDRIHPELGVSYAELWRDYRSAQLLRPVKFEWDGKQLPCLPS
ncbi:MAG: 2-amino-4-hydroxy-6-hydroxymethyldihydropteridine diphosphokinase [Hahellaceae bacterium]|nr:2-amino-4-hydroxy-6-hydroxymethyldihydropteridine diphosphokinase [Hahellaceae bacterium]MCP5168491.1 2-amino-4-hydroxy-6-hydroxymethyldihydropteridine diphosphokinase [Hahellaceae bacterium]